MTELINLTGEDVVLLDENYQVQAVIKPRRDEVRFHIRNEPVTEYVERDGIQFPIHELRYLSPSNGISAEPVPGVFYIVKHSTAFAALSVNRSTKDMLVPTSPVSGPNRTTLGYRKLTRFNYDKPSEG